MNLVNIFSGFRVTGIFPFKPNDIPIEAYEPSKHLCLMSVEASTENGNEVSNEQNQSRVTETANEEQPVSAVSPQVPSTSSEGNYLREILRTPGVVKKRTEKKTRRVTEARFLTERDFLDELKRKEGKDQRKKEREKKKKTKDLEQKLKKSSKAKKATKKRLAKNKENDRSLAKHQSDSCCTYCTWNYMDYHSNDGDWVKCTRCSDWYHESCTGKFWHELLHFVGNKH
ncbi:unnamed protein product [Mytilus coruscus]|uniref:Uncharacterized protein n=1 Tax=Mytilus coruscus TaxID=42192 RepID=A0A6J8E0V7_MYTCO|nr:unnamed protein product [Mytilus coruscus]